MKIDEILVFVRIGKIPDFMDAVIFKGIVLMKTDRGLTDIQIIEKFLYIITGI